ncbi:MAG: TIGR04086 family membrane protein [Oscillospiraceae bacterium]|nr:TIGR04086 family membrane protein [Oscillospiraceae bacterium]
MRDKHDEPKRLLKPLLMSLAVGLLMSLTILAAGAAMVSSGMIRQSHMPAAAGAACLAGAFVVGARSVSLMKSRALMAGIAGGLGYFMALFLLGSVLYLRGLPSTSATTMLITGIAGGLAAGIMGALHKPRNMR